MVQAGGKANIEMFFDDFAGNAANLAIADASVIRALGRGVARFREAERAAIFIEEIFLLEAEPSGKLCHLSAILFNN